MKIVPDGMAAQNIVNQLRASAILESADDASVAYLEACEAMGEALITLLAHSKALAKISPEHAFTQFYPQAVEVPVFQNLPAFEKFPHHRVAIYVNDPAQLARAADAVMLKSSPD